MKYQSLSNQIAILLPQKEGLVKIILDLFHSM